MKKFGTVLVAGALACTMALSVGLAGCGGGKKADFVMPEGGFDTSKPVTITFDHTMGQSSRAILQSAAAKFTELYPNITIEGLDKTASSDYDTLRDSLYTRIVAGSQPNIAYCYSDHVATYNTAGAVQPLDDFLPGGAYADMTVSHADGTTEPLGLTQQQADNYIDGYYNEGKAFADGKMYTLPFIKSSEVLYYNYTAFETNGWEVPTTWDEMEDLLKAIKTKYPESIPLVYDSEANWFITMCMQLGTPYTSITGEKYLFDTPENQEFVSRFAQWYQNGWILTRSLNNDKYGSDLFKSTDAKKCYMCIGSTGGASYQMSSSEQGTFAFRVGIAGIPQANPEKPQVISQGPSVCIFKSNDPQEVLASWLFVKYLTTNVDFQAEFAMDSGYVPVLEQDVMKTNAVYGELLEMADGEGNLMALAQQVCMSLQDAYFVSPAFEGSAKARDQVGLLMQAAFTHPDAVDAAFKSAIAECKH